MIDTDINKVLIVEINDVSNDFKVVPNYKPILDLKTGRTFSFETKHATALWIAVNIKEDCIHPQTMFFEQIMNRKKELERTKSVLL